MKKQEIFLFLKKEVFTIFLALFLLMPVITISDESPPRDALQAAQEGLSSFLNSIPKNELMLYNFPENANLTQATLGEPVNEYSITPQKIINYDFHTSIKDLLLPTNLWYFPIIYNSKVRTILIVDFFEQKWQAVAIGYSGLAVQIKLITDKLRNDNITEYQFLRIYQAKSDFIITSQDKITRLIPLESAKVGLKLSQANDVSMRFYKPSEIMKKLQIIVSKNLLQKE